MAAVTDKAVLVNISDMIDLALGTPEVGVVDFNMLQTVLHCLAQQLCVLDKNVELRGSVAALPVVPNRDNVQTIAISEFVVDVDEPPKPHIDPPKPAGKEDVETMLVVERVKKNEDGKSSTSKRPNLDAPSRPAPSTAAPTAAPSVIAPPTTAPSAGGQAPPSKIGSTERLTLVTLSKFNILENTVDDLKNRVYGSIPKNETILEEVRSQTNLKAIQDMWTNLNVSSRLEAAEEGIKKLSSLVEDLIAASSCLQDVANRRPSSTNKLPAPPSKAVSQTQPPAQVQSQTTQGQPATAQVPQPTNQDLTQIQDSLNQLRNDLDNLKNTMEGLQRDGQGGPGKGEQNVPGFDATGQGQPESQGVTGGSPADGAESTVAESGGPGSEGGKGTIASPGGGIIVSSGAATPGSTAGTPSRVMPCQKDQIYQNVTVRLIELERRLKICCDNVGKQEGLVQDQLNAFQDQLEYMSKQIASLTQDLTGGKISPDLLKDLQGLMDLFQTVQDMKEQLRQVHETALQLASEKEDRQSHMNALLEQIEMLKIMKLDREDMAEAMADKADLRMLARKVSHDQFELACDDLSRGLDHALGKLNLQEALWQQALDDIQREIETKLDKMELSPVKDFFNSKLRQLQENLKQMASLRREVEAAGTKKKLLREVNCISCDANAAMAMEVESRLPVGKPLPGNLSMKPYLSYELDAIRRTQAANVPQRNMHDWENIDKQTQLKAPLKASRSEVDKHTCNRYCGGSHTTTTPAQRVARLGHFIKQWGPDVLPLSSGLAAGDDGRLYRVSEGANVGPGGPVETNAIPKTKKPELPKPPTQKPIIMGTPDCRCLDPNTARPSKS